MAREKLGPSFLHSSPLPLLPKRPLGGSPVCGLAGSCGLLVCPALGLTLAGRGLSASDYLFNLCSFSLGSKVPCPPHPSGPRPVRSHAG